MAGAGKTAVIAGTFDTKGAELGYIAGLLAGAGLKTRTIDLSTGGKPVDTDVTAAEVADCHPQGRPAVLDLPDRGESIAAMAIAFEIYTRKTNGIDGMIGAGGSGGTALVAPAMRALPVGLPKVLVSTVASGNVAPYVGPSDIAMIYSVTDVQGLNLISRRILGNAAHALAGMMLWGDAIPTGAGRPALGLTMFGVNTTCVSHIADALQATHDPLVFHATGTGGQAMEKLVDSGLITGVLDLTTTEIADLLVGGIFPAHADRLGAMIRTRVPYVGSCGALDMVNFGARDSVPARFSDRQFLAHNPQVTLMRTTPAENRRIGEWIAARLNQMTGPVRFLIPQGGVSAIDAPGQPFHDPEADAALFDAIETGVTQNQNRAIRRVPHNLNTPEFAEIALAEFRAISGGS